MKPTNSRAIATVTFSTDVRAATSLQKRDDTRTSAFQAMTRLGSDKHVARMSEA